MNSHFKELLSIFADHKVKYLVVGGYAVAQHAEPRYTKDLDVWIEASLENSRRVFGALQAFGAPLSGLTERDFAQRGFFYQMGRPPARVDVVMSIDGITFEAAWPNRVQVEIEGVQAVFISRADLITNKRAVGRPQDLIDADALALAESVCEGLQNTDKNREDY